MSKNIYKYSADFKKRQNKIFFKQKQLILK